jgi:signal peptidase I
MIRVLLVVGCGAIAVLAGLIAVVLRRRFVVVRVEGKSMEPTLRDGDRVLVRRTSIAGVAPGVVVVLEPPEPVDGPRWLVKRAVALPGDPVPRATVPALRDVPEPVVPEGCLVVMGDNTARSHDSRRAGYFPAATLLGIVIRQLR